MPSGYLLCRQTCLYLSLTRRFTVRGGEKLCEFCFVTLQICKFEFLFLDAYHLDALYMIVVELVYEWRYLCEIS